MKLERRQWQTENSCKSKKQQKTVLARRVRPRCLPETENAIRANGPPNTPQVHGADGYMIVGSVVWNEDWLGPAANPHEVRQASQILRGPGVNCVSLIGAVYVWYLGCDYCACKLRWFISLCHFLWVCDAFPHSRTSFSFFRARVQVTPNVSARASLKSRASASWRRSVSQSEKWSCVWKYPKPWRRAGPATAHAFIF